MDIFKLFLSKFLNENIFSLIEIFFVKYLYGSIEINIIEYEY